MTKIIDLSNLNIESQDQLDSHIKHCIVGEPLVEFDSLHIESCDRRRAFDLETLHKSIEKMLVHLYQLLDESGQPLANQAEVEAYLIETIKNCLSVIELAIEEQPELIPLLFDAYCRQNLSPEILTLTFALCSLSQNADRQTELIEFTLDRFSKLYPNYSELFTEALKHAWNPMLDKRLKQIENNTENPHLKKAVETILNFRNETQGTIRSRAISCSPYIG